MLLARRLRDWAWLSCHLRTLGLVRSIIATYCVPRDVTLPILPLGRDGIFGVVGFSSFWRLARWIETRQISLR